MTNHLLEAKRDDIGALRRKQDVAKEVEVLRCAGEVLRLRSVDVPRDAERTNRSEGAEVGLTKVELGV